MKRIAAILLSAALMVIAAAAPVSAAGFQLTDSNPTDGYEKVEAKNVMIKLFFSEDVSATETQEANKDKIVLEDSKGKEVECEILYDSKDSKKICVLAENDLKSEKKYTVKIDAALVSDDGNTLGEAEEITFTTKSSDTGSGYMILMLLMIVVMVVMTFRDQKKAMQQEGTQDPLAGLNMNPYKLAKEKNISVAEAAKLIEAEREKALKKAGKKQNNAKGDNGSSNNTKSPDGKSGTKNQGGKTAQKGKNSGKADEIGSNSDGRAEKNVYKVKTKRVVKRK